MFFAWRARSSKITPKNPRPRLLVEELEGRVVPSIFIPVTNHRDLVWDPYRSQLDITTSTGSVQVFNLNNMGFQPPLNVGGNLAGADISADGTTLLVAQQQVPTGQSVLHKFNLNTGQRTDLVYPTIPGESSAWDVALGAGSKGLVTQSSPNGSPTLLRQVDLASSNPVVGRPDAPGSAGGGRIGPSSQVHRSADRSTLLITESGFPYGPFFTYNSQTDTFSYPNGLNTSLTSALTAVSRWGNLLAIQVNGSTTILSRNYSSYNVVAVLNGIDGGVAFDPAQDLLYGVQSSAGQILAFDTNTWAVRYQMPTEEAVPRGTPLGNGVMTVSTDARWLFLATPHGVRAYPLPSAPGPVVRLSVGAFPTVATAGTPGSFTVKASDANGNVVTGYLGTVHFTSSDPQAVLPADYTFTPSDLGVHTFTVTLKTASGPLAAITATDTRNSSLNGTQSGIRVLPGPVASFTVSPSASAQPVGYAFSVAVTAFDAYNNIASNYLGKVHFTSSDAAAQLPADYTYTSADGGRHTFTVVLNTAGNQTITVNNTGSPSAQGSTTVLAGNYIPGLWFTLSPSTTTPTAGAPFSLTVTARDQYNQVATHYVGTITFTTSDGGAGVVLPPDYTFTAADAGVHTFSNGLTLVTAGNRSVTIRDTAYITGATVTSTTVTVVPAAASLFQVAGFPAAVTAGAGGTFTVTARDPYGNVATGYGGTVHFTSSDAQASLPADATLTNGSGSFSATLKTAGTQSLTAADAATGTPAGAQTGIAVSPAAASTLLVAGFPASVTAGTAGTFSVTALDAYGNVATGYSGTVHVTSSDPQADLPADATLTNGAGTFSVTLKTAGAQSLTATDTANGALTGSQAGIAVNAAAASVLVISGPSTVTAGVAFTFTVTALDAYGNVATGYTGTVSFGSSDAAAELPDAYTFTADDAGVHTFSATFWSLDSQTLTALDDAGGLSGNLNVVVLPS
jgi:hypothetical protein